MVPFSRSVLENSRRGESFIVVSDEITNLERFSFKIPELDMTSAKMKT